MGYTVYVNGPEYRGNNKTLDNSSCYRVLCVLKGLMFHKDPIATENVSEVTFAISEFVPWLKKKTVSYKQISETEAAGIEERLQDIILLDTEAVTVIFSFTSKTCKNAMNSRSSTSVLVEKVPEIRIQYHVPASLERVRSDIQMNMEFWGLIIGHVSTVDDILVLFGNEDQHYCYQMYMNTDYSYNLRSVDLFHGTTTHYDSVKDKLPSLYLNWNKFFHDDKYTFLKNNYFAVNRRYQSFLEDMFVTYVRFLEGYDLRQSGDDKKKEKIFDAIKPIEKDIKNRIREDELKEKLEQVISPILPEWKINSSHAGEMASWIAGGYIGRTSLQTRLKRIDDAHLNIIAKNVSIINQKQSEEEDERKFTSEEYYAKIVDTRNYYSHYKESEKNILSTSEMLETANVLKALILMIFYENMGMTVEDARKIIIWDSELGFETQCLMKDNDKASP